MIEHVCAQSGRHVNLDKAVSEINMSIGANRETQTHTNITFNHITQCHVTVCCSGIHYIGVTFHWIFTCCTYIICRNVFQHGVAHYSTMMYNASSHSRYTVNYVIITFAVILCFADQPSTWWFSLTMVFPIENKLTTQKREILTSNTKQDNQQGMLPSMTNKGQSTKKGKQCCIMIHTRDHLSNHGRDLPTQRLPMEPRVYPLNIHKVAIYVPSEASSKSHQPSKSSGWVLRVGHYPE